MVNVLEATSALEHYRLGAVVVPARDGILKELGHDVGSLGIDALGFVAETKPKKCFVVFPQMALSLWVDKSELADVEWESLQGGERAGSFQKLIPVPSSAKTFAEEGVGNPSWIVWRLTQMLEVNTFLGFEKGLLAEVWDDRVMGVLRRHYEGDANQSVCRISLGIDELYWKSWQDVERFLADRLLFARFLPAGLHKIEVSLFLKTS